MSLRDFALRSQTRLPPSLHRLLTPLHYTGTPNPPPSSQRTPMPTSPPAPPDSPGAQPSSACTAAASPARAAAAAPPRQRSKEWYYLQADLTPSLLREVRLDTGAYQVLLQGGCYTTPGPEEARSGVTDDSVPRVAACALKAVSTSGPPAVVSTSAGLEGSAPAAVLQSAEGTGAGGGSAAAGASAAGQASARRLRVSQQPRLWASPQGAVSPLHYDRSASLLTQVRGRKRMVFFAPDDVQRTYSYPDTHMLARRSRVNVHAPDWDRFPGFAGLAGLEVELGPGDLVYFGPLWSHFTESVTASMSVTCRYAADTANAAVR